MMEKTVLNDISLLEYYKVENEETLRAIVQKRKDKNKDEKQKILLENQERSKYL